MKIKSGTKQVTLYRMLLAGLVYDAVGMSAEEMIALFELNERLGKKMSEDPGFQDKHGNLFETSNVLLRKLKVQRYPYLPPPQLRKEMQDTFGALLPSAHDYFGWSRDPKRRVAVSITTSSALPPPKKLPPKRYIGVGYKDSGNRRDPAIDGVSHIDLMKSPHPVLDQKALDVRERERIEKYNSQGQKNVPKPGPRGRG